MLKETLDQKFVSNYRNSKLCAYSNCRKFTIQMITANSGGNWFCYNCAKRTDILDNVNYKIVTIDSQFKCRASSCSATDLTFWDAYYGKCCDNAILAAFKANYSVDLTSLDFSTIINGDDLKKITDGLNVLKEQEDTSRTEFVTAEAKLAALTEHRQLIKNKAAAIFKDARNSLLDNEEKETKEDKHFECKICFEKYDKLERFHCTLLCGHRACLRCLKSVPEKLCSTCRKPYTDEQIIKLY